MIERKDFIEKLGMFLTPATCNALADYAERVFDDSEDGEISRYEVMLVHMGDYAGLPLELKEYIEDCIADDAAAGDKITELAESMIDEW